MVKQKRKKVSFWATKTVKKPVRVSFSAKRKKVSFWATKTVKKPVRVSFLAKKKNRR